MSPAGVPSRPESSRLEVCIKQKFFRAASGDNLHVLGELSFTLENGEVAALVGPSGCGKPTLLPITPGPHRDSQGPVRRPAHCRLGMVFQEPRLLPWRSVEANVRLAAPEATDATLEALF